MTEQPVRYFGEVLEETPNDVAVGLGSHETPTRRIRRQRTIELLSSPITVPELNIDDNLKYCTTGERFFQYGFNFERGLNLGSDLAVFYSELMINKLRQQSVWAMDGTFDIVTSPFIQLYTIVIIKNNHVIPVIYAFLKNKRRQTYVNYLYII